MSENVGKIKKNVKNVKTFLHLWFIELVLDHSVSGSGFIECLKAATITSFKEWDFVAIFLNFQF